MLFCAFLCLHIVIKEYNGVRSGYVYCIFFIRKVMEEQIGVFIICYAMLCYAMLCYVILCSF
jgi:hypothetical protein